LQMGNELSSIGDIISPYIIDDNYKINNELEWTGYRRIIGLIILIILIAIMRTCNNFNNQDKNQVINQNKNQSKNHKIWVGKGGAVAAAPVAAVLASGAGAGGAAAAAGGLGTAVAGTGGAAAAAGGLGSAAAGSGGAAALASAAGQSVASNAAQNMAKDAMANGKAGNGRSTSAKMMDFATGGKYSKMRNAGMSRFGSGLELSRQAGQYGADKFKEFANWLYEILFAIAISIAICMIVVPSIAFFILGLICYFLLRKKIMTMKAF
jgi:hypothetical protein